MTVSRYDGIVDDDEPFWDELSWTVIRDQSDQIEFDWFAVDRNGMLGAFASFGTGPSPAGVRSSRERFNRLLHAVACLENAHPVAFHQPVLGDVSSWAAFAKRGLYAFDNADVHGEVPAHHYLPIAWSTQPLALEASGIPKDLHDALPRVDVEFAPDVSVPFALIPQ